MGEQKPRILDVRAEAHCLESARGGRGLEGGIEATIAVPNPSTGTPIQLAFVGRESSPRRHRPKATYLPVLARDSRSLARPGDCCTGAFFFLPSSPSLTSLSSGSATLPGQGRGGRLLCGSGRARGRAGRGRRQSGWLLLLGWFQEPRPGFFSPLSLALFSAHFFSSPPLPGARKWSLPFVARAACLALRARAHTCLLSSLCGGGSRSGWGGGRAMRQAGPSDPRRPLSRDGAVYSARGSLCRGACARMRILFKRFVSLLETVCGERVTLSVSVLGRCAQFQFGSLFCRKFVCVEVQLKLKN